MALPLLRYARGRAALLVLPLLVLVTLLPVAKPCSGPPRTCSQAPSFARPVRGPRPTPSSFYHTPAGHCGKATGLK